MKKMISLHKLLLMMFAALALACGGSSGSDDSTDDDPGNPDPQQQLPGKAGALLPVNGEPCSEFEDVAGEADKALIFFQWSAASSANSYRIDVLEGGNGVASASLSERETQFVLDRGKTFTWTVTAINDDGQTISDTFSFTSPGVPVGNFAPYAAEISLDFDIANVEMNISWTASDEDGDPLTFDVEVLQEGVSIESFTDLTDTFLAPLPYIPGDNYEIRVTSRDDAGNFSISVLEEEAPE